VKERIVVSVSLTGKTACHREDWVAVDVMSVIRLTIHYVSYKYHVFIKMS